MFSIVKENFYGIEKIKLLNHSSGEYVSAIPFFGGNLNELVLLKNNRLHSIIAGDEKLETLSGIGSSLYRGAKLSPFVNRIKNGQYTFGGYTYQLKKNAPPHALHGLCWNIPFAIKEQVATYNFARLVLLANYESLHEGFPFTYQIEIEYTLEKNNLKCSTRILNTSKQSIPIGDGWHPYFTTGSKINTLKLQIPAGKRLEMDESQIPSGNYLSGQSFAVPLLINNTQLDNCYELNATGIVETRLIDEYQDISIVVYQDTSRQGYRFLQIYTPPDRNSIAIEPMSCAPDSFNNKNGLIILPANESIQFCFGIRLE